MFYAVLVFNQYSYIANRSQEIQWCRTSGFLLIVNVFIIDCDECFNRPCNTYTAAVACENTIGSYKCGCEHGYSGQNCQLGR